MYYVELYKGRLRVAAKLAGRPQPWRWRAKARNGEKLAQSEAYVDKVHAIHTIHLLFGPSVEIREV